MTWSCGERAAFHRARPAGGKARLIELYMWLVYRLKRVSLPDATTINTDDCVRRRMYASLDLERRECRLLEFPGNP